MKVVKINKSFRNGSKEHFLVLLDEPYSNDDIDYLVEREIETLKTKKCEMEKYLK